jgi:hypothetical protein
MLYATNYRTLYLPTRMNKRHVRASKPHKTSVQVKAELLSLVQTGVERFILKHASVEEFLKMTRTLAEKEKAYSHQLTRTVFSRIVREAVRKRNLRETK